MCAQTFRNTAATGLLEIHLQIHDLLLSNDDGQWRVDSCGKIALQTLLPIQEAEKSFETYLCEWIIFILQSIDTVEQHTFVKRISAAKSRLAVPSAGSI